MVATALLFLAAPLAGAKQVVLKVFIRDNQVEVNWENKIFAAFEAKNPDIKLDVISNAGSDYSDKLATLWAAGDPPDVWDHGGQMATYDYNGWLLDIGRFIKQDQGSLDVKDVFPGAWNAYITPDHAWGLPFISAPTYMWYNADLLDQAGLAKPPVNWDNADWTLDRVRDYAKKLTRLDGSGKVTQYGLGIASSPYVDVNIARLGGSDWFNPQAWTSGIVRETTFDTPQNEATYRKFIEMIHSDNVATRDAWGTWFAGTAAMTFGEGPWLVMGQTQNIKFRWGMAPNPRAPKQSTILYTDAWVIGSRTKNPEAAWRFIKYMTSRAVLEDYLTIGQYPPSRRSTLNAYLRTMADASGTHTPAQILEGISTAHNYAHEAGDHVIVGELEMRNALTPIWNDMWNNTIPVREALIRADQILKPILAKYPAQKR